MPDDPLPSSMPGNPPSPAPAPERSTEPVTDAQTVLPSGPVWGNERPPLPSVPGYEILEEIARGGMGVIYKARQVSLNRTVALKMMLAGSLAGPEDLGRFRKEAEAVARLEDPHIVRVYDFGTQDGMPFFTMEYIDGGSLKDRLARERVGYREAASLVATLGRAMHRAHQAGIVHRDIKPANILLRSSGTPVITDFGLAKRLGAPGDGGTATGVVMGTAPYMAPEQASGRPRDVGPHTDVWALGILLYEMLTGHPPFEAPSTLDVLVQVVSHEHVPPSRRQPGVPPALDTLCSRCLAKEPARRYPSAAALAEALDAFLIATATAQPSTAGYEVLEEVRHAGAMTLYRARESATGAAVALRVFDLEACGGPEARAAAIRTAMLVGQLRHLHIAAVQSVSERHGKLLLQREWAGGGTLADPPQRRTWAVEEAVALSEALAGALDHAHRQGVLHRALRPSNVLLGAEGKPLLADFQPPGFPEAPREPHAALSPGHLAPEQLAGGAAAPTFAIDLYAVGVLLYELLTGRHPYQGTRTNVLLYQMKVGPPPPSQLRPGVPAAVDAVCLRCLQADPKERPRSAAEVAAALGRVLRPQEAGPAGGAGGKEEPGGRTGWGRWFGWMRRPRPHPPGE
jgi:serine/threonine protein kinase